mgnify:CR=1 FL=1
MKVLVIEDEQLAAQRLSKMVQTTMPEAEISAILPSIKSSIEWFLSNPAPDLIFMDIQLGDGISFDIFKHCKIESPIIFTTAYNEYSLQAFKLNSLDYLLKPIDQQELENAIHKFKSNLEKPSVQFAKLASAYEQMMKMMTSNYKSRFVLKLGEKIKILKTDEIEALYSLEKATYALTTEIKTHLLDYSLDQVEKMIDPSVFFRINRKYIISIHGIRDITAYSNSRLKIKLIHLENDELIVSREKVNEFKSWLDK